MQKTLVRDLKPGIIAARDIFNHNGVLLLPKGTLLDHEFIESLKSLGIEELYTEADNHAAKKAISDFISNLRIDDVVCENTKVNAYKQIQKVMMKFSLVGKADLDNIGEIVENIIDQLLSKKSIMLSLSGLRSIDNYTYEHSLNVCVLSLIIGIDMNIDRSRLSTLGTGAIMHDIGKAYVSEDILKKPGKLTPEEYDEIKKHTEYGYQMLLNSDISEEAAQIALNHHEKYDGTGYTKGLSGDEIPLFSRIVAIADVYDAMSNDRIYKKKSSPDFVYRELARQAGKHFDSAVADKFFRHLSLYPVGTGVVLNTNHKGVVISQNKYLPESPVVRIFRKAAGSRSITYTDIDLSTVKHLYIKDTF
jgi:putative nucleotidyltransferase with HDIG domain